MTVCYWAGLWALSMVASLVGWTVDLWAYWKAAKTGGSSVDNLDVLLAVLWVRWTVALLVSTSAALLALLKAELMAEPLVGY